MAVPLPRHAVAETLPGVLRLVRDRRHTARTACVPMNDNPRHVTPGRRTVVDMSDLITTPFGFTSTAGEVLAGVDLTGKRAVVTGGATGIGRETTRALAAAGAEVTIATRDVAAARRLAGELAGNVQAAALDLADLDSVD